VSKICPFLQLKDLYYLCLKPHPDPYDPYSITLPPNGVKLIQDDAGRSKKNPIPPKKFLLQWLVENQKFSAVYLQTSLAEEICL